MPQSMHLDCQIELKFSSVAPSSVAQPCYYELPNEYTQVVTKAHKLTRNRRSIHVPDQKAIENCQNVQV